MYDPNGEFVTARKKLLGALIRRGHTTPSHGLILGVELLRSVLEGLFETRTLKATLNNIDFLIDHPNIDLEHSIDEPSNLWIAGLYSTQPSPDMILGFTPLLLTVLTCQVKMTAALVRAGASIQRRAPCGFSPLELARYNCEITHPRQYWFKNEFEGIRYFFSVEQDFKMLKFLEDALEARGEEVESDTSLPENRDSLMKMYDKGKKKTSNEIGTFYITLLEVTNIPGPLTEVQRLITFVSRVFNIEALLHLETLTY
jgi:hypothetical protein